jgi:hypothetical protein
MSTSETTAKPRVVSLPWGRAEVVDEVTFAGTNLGERTIAVGIQHLRERDGGAELVRFFYRADDRMIRGPLTLRADERTGLKAALADAPALRKLLQELV